MLEPPVRNAAGPKPSGGAQTFLVADLVGYTALTEAMGDEQAADVAAELGGVVRALLPDYRAEEIKTIGDALLLRVPHAGEAVRLAARLEAEFGKRHGSLGVRVGIHTGSAVQRDGDWFGSAVNLATRVAEQARPGEVLMTSATAEAAGTALLPGQVKSRGKRQLKNVPEPVELLALALDSSAGARQLPIDPVCRMAVDPAQGVASYVYRGAEYHFCSETCHIAFTRAPRRYLRRPSGRDVLLVSERARERTAGRLARAYVTGRLRHDEFEGRIERAWAARTGGDLRDITHDLPGKRRPLLVLIWRVLRARARRFRRLLSRRRLPGPR